MVTARKKAPPSTSPIQLSVKRFTPRLNKSPLLMMRLKELDEEFHRQTQQLAKITQKLSKKLTNKL